MHFLIISLLFSYMIAMDFERTVCLGYPVDVANGVKMLPFAIGPCVYKKILVCQSVSRYSCNAE